MDNLGRRRSILAALKSRHKIVCRGCGKLKNDTEFYDDFKARYKKQARCKECQRNYGHEYNQRRKNRRVKVDTNGRIAKIAWLNNESQLAMSQRNPDRMRELAVEADEIGLKTLARELKEASR